MSAGTVEIYCPVNKVVSIVVLGTLKVISQISDLVFGHGWVSVLGVEGLLGFAGKRDLDLLGIDGQFAFPGDVEVSLAVAFLGPDAAFILAEGLRDS